MFGYGIIPISYESFIHLLYRSERTILILDYCFVSEVRICYKECSHSKRKTTQDVVSWVAD